MHRLGSGAPVLDLDAQRRAWRAAGKTGTTYCSRRDYNDWQEDFGELVASFPDGTEIRTHATVVTTCRGGTPKIIHNCAIVGNPAAWAAWNADPRPTSEKGWMARWTFYSIDYLDRLVARHQNPEDPNGQDT